MIGIVTDLGYVNVIQRLIVHMSMWGKVCYFSSYSIIACSGAFNPVTPWWSLGLTRALTKLLCQLCLWYDENKQTAVGSLYCMSLGKCIYISFWLPCSCLFPLHSWSTSLARDTRTGFCHAHVPNTDTDGAILSRSTVLWVMTQPCNKNENKQHIFTHQGMSEEFYLLSTQFL